MCMRVCYLLGVGFRLAEQLVAEIGHICRVKYDQILRSDKQLSVKVYLLSRYTYIYKQI